LETEGAISHSREAMISVIFSDADFPLDSAHAPD
jgi:hypothetical protein